MPQQLLTSVESNFTKGLITEGTALNFPENAAQDTDNSQYGILGNIQRREGINFETNFSQTISFGTGNAKASYKWNNAGGDGSSQIVVEQVGTFLYFYLSSSATIASPLSNQILSTPVNISTFKIGNTFNTTLECQFSDGNGYLFVYHPGCNPFYCTFNPVTLTVIGTPIGIQIRDFSGVEDGLSIGVRPTTLSTEHSYNLANQGWVIGNPWQGTSSTSFTPPSILGAHVFVIQAGLPVTLGQAVQCYGHNSTFPQFNVYYTGTVTAYAGVNLTVNVTSIYIPLGFEGSFPYNVWSITPTNTGYVGTWFTAEGNYPSNSDVWWYFKNASGVFDPATTQPNVTVSVGNAPKGHFILSAFNQSRTAISGISGITDVTTVKRPSTGTWFQGRVWFTGLDDSQQPTGDASYYTWTENIYFSQTVITAADFGKCYQVNDPTSETLFGLLPTDGGVITIQGSGTIYKLFPIQNGMLVFAANGIWFITGSQGIGFSANDYTITKISAVRSISGTSFVDVHGLPYFWNEEGIYQVTPSKNGSLEVNPLTVSTILTFYNQIPLSSKKYVKGAYNPINYIIQWVYQGTEAPSVDGRYSYNKILNYNTYNQAFFPYTVDNSNTAINGILYVAGPGGSTSPLPMFKYPCSTPSGGNFLLSFAEENDSAFVDWGSINYISYFVTGYKIRGQGIKKSQPQYIQLYNRTNDEANSYKIQGIWDYGNNRNSGRWSSVQQINQGVTRFDNTFKRVKIRGSGYVLQFKISSTDGRPFDIQGWAVVDTVNQGT